MTGIFIKKQGEDKLVFFNGNFIKEHNLKPNLIEVIQFLIPLQIAKGTNEWIILKLEETAEKLNIPRPTLSRYLKQLEDENILIHEDFRSTLWKINPNIMLIVE